MILAEEFKVLEYEELKKYIVETYHYDEDIFRSMIGRYNYIKRYNINYLHENIVDNIEQDHEGLIKEVGMKAYLVIMEDINGLDLNDIIKSSEGFSINDSMNTYIALKAYKFGELSSDEQRYSRESQNFSVELYPDNIFKYECPTQEQMIIGFKHYNYTEVYYDDLVYIHTPDTDEYIFRDIVKAMAVSSKNRFENILNKIDRDYLSQIELKVTNIDEDKINFEVTSRRDNDRLNFNITVTIDMIELGKKLDESITSERQDEPIEQLKDVILEEIIKNKDVEAEIKEVSENREIVYLDTPRYDLVTDDIFEHFEAKNMAIISVNHLESYKRGEYNLKTKDFIVNNITNYYNGLTEEEREDYMFLNFNSEYESEYLTLENSKDKLDFFIDSIVKSEDVSFILSRHNEIFNEIDYLRIRDEYNDTEVVFISLVDPYLNEVFRYAIYEEYLKNNEIGYYDKEVQKNEMLRAIDSGLDILNKKYGFQIKSNAQEVYNVGGLDYLINEFEILSEQDLYKDYINSSELNNVISEFRENENYLSKSIFDVYLDQEEYVYFVDNKIVQNNLKSRHIFERTLLIDVEKDYQQEKLKIKREDGHDL